MNTNCVFLLLMYVCFTTAERSYKGSRNQQYQDNAIKIQDLLFQNGKYRKNTSPGYKTSTKIDFTLLELGDFDDIRGQLKIVGTIHLSWEDTRLSWNKTEIDSTVVSFRLHEVWRPHISLYNSLDKFEIIGHELEETLVWYRYDGTAYFLLGGVYSTTCDPNVQYFPYDVHECSVIFIPFENMMSHGHRNTSSVKLYDSLIKTKYDIKTDDGKWVYHAMKPCIVRLESGFDAAVFPLRFKRRSTFTFLNIIFPVMCLGYLNLCVFLIPVQAGERVSFSVTVFLSFTVFMLFISDIVPEVSDPMPILSLFLVFKLAYSSCVVIAVIIVTRLFHHNEKHPLPKILIKLITCVESFKRERCCRKVIESMEDTVTSSNCLPDHEDDSFEKTWKRASVIIERMFLSIFVFLEISETIVFVLLLSNTLGTENIRFNSYICASEKV